MNAYSVVAVSLGRMFVVIRWFFGVLVVLGVFFQFIGRIFNDWMCECVRLDKY